MDNQQQTSNSLVVCGFYRLIKHIGSGSFGEIYQGEDIRTKNRVAIKLEPAKMRSPQLELEYKIYNIFSDGNNVPRVYYYGSDANYNVLVMDLLGLSLEDIFAEHLTTFSLKTVLMLADQMLTSIQYVHEKNFIHRDIKPDNFIMGVGSHSNQVYVIDFGLSKKYRDPKTKMHIRYVENKSLTGTARYASINAMRGCEQSRRDDLESLGYVWLYFLRGSLPWQGLPARTTKQKYEKILNVKLETSAEELCQGFPNEFVRYFEIVKGLQFTEEPDYSGLRQMFKDLFIRLGYTYDYSYDWVKAKIIRSTKPPIPLHCALPPQPMTQPVTPKHSPREEHGKKKGDATLPFLIKRIDKKEKKPALVRKEAPLRKVQTKWNPPEVSFQAGERRQWQKPVPQFAFHISKLQIPSQAPMTRLPSPKRYKERTELAKKKIYRRWSDKKFETPVYH